ncbi:glutamate--cysteine ligase catalytic subunit [Nematocida homosporus]|uniref:glutamate--cysteine ligase catalytic subunit n=1 Tax=Nematocida homosporus TaxID=1912981 RepID=UPI0022205807|nr:glutamate--cysteine ligase catalytic subunit [Nematocida homosporus]KAI5185952.1 glutamate--cysteine ligase catalytic subunit [Nematocida homosporus]
MGLLKENRTLSWKETQLHGPVLKKRGLEYFLEVYTKSLPSRTKGFLWGDEIEQNLVFRSPTGWYLLIAADQVIEGLKQENAYVLNVEYSGYMLESTPRMPYGPQFKVLGRVEADMETRRLAIESYLTSQISKDAGVLSLPCFPLLGTPFAFGIGRRPDGIAYTPAEWEELWRQNYQAEITNPQGVQGIQKDLRPGTPLEKALRKIDRPTFAVTRSEHFPDFGITQHLRFYNFTYNIRERRGRPLRLAIPPAQLEAADGSFVPGAQPVIIDSMGQGMGCCCLQITMQSESMAEARLLYDNIGALCPLLLFLTMATPVVAGTLTESATRWEIVSASVDCRTLQETHIKKSRYSSIDLYTSEMTPELYAYYNDINPPLDPSALAQLQVGGVDLAMTNHIASIYIRDPVLCYEETSPQEDFENIQSSNWRSMRLKPPKASNPTGSWLVEVRPMEIQPTSFENAAYSVFVILFSRMILSLNYTFYLPISRVDENFQAANSPRTHLDSTAAYLDLEAQQEFWYRANICSMDKAEIRRGTIKDIFLGNGEYLGILEAIEKYLAEYSEQDRQQVAPYLKFIRERVSGQKLSVATYIRRYLTSHPLYTGNSQVSQELSDELVQHIIQISQKNSPDYLNK